MSISVGCKKESITESQQTEKTLKKSISDNAIGRVLTLKEGDFEPGTMDSANGVNFSFHDGYLDITNQNVQTSYNLAYLKDYKIKTLTINDTNPNLSKSAKVLILTFSK